MGNFRTKGAEHTQEEFSEWATKYKVNPNQTPYKEDSRLFYKLPDGGTIVIEEGIPEYFKS